MVEAHEMVELKPEPGKLETTHAETSKPLTAPSSPAEALRRANVKPSVHVPHVKAVAKDLNFYYGRTQVLKNINMNFAENQVTALIGPSGCGKTTLLRCFNRMHDLYPGNRYEGEIILYPDGKNIIARNTEPVEMRMRVGMVFQKPNPYPKSIFENVAFGLKLHGIKGSELRDRVEQALKDAALWGEVSERLKGSAYGLSGGQQQRLCIARALATEPEIMLFDEPTSALDPIATDKIEELVHSLKGRVTVIIVTHNMKQAARVSDYTGFMYLGELIEFGDTQTMFVNPAHKMTTDYVTGRFG